MDTVILVTTIAAAAIRIAVPLLLCALAGLYSERSGVVDIALEGKMLAGAFAAAVAAYATGSAWVGLAAAILVSVGFALLHGLASITYRGNQIVSGVAINMLALGLTAFIGNVWYGRGGSTPNLSGSARFSSLTLPFAEEIRSVPVIGPLYANVLSGHSILTYLAFACVPLTAWIIYRTRFGLRLRAVGENPAAADTAGVSVTWVRFRAVVICGILTGIAGAYLSTAISAFFSPNMTAGRGYMGLAALIFSRWRPYQALFACLLFGMLNAISINLGANLVIAGIPIESEYIDILPYVLTVLMLAGFGGVAVPPRAAGVPYVKER